MVIIETFYPNYVWVKQLKKREFRAVLTYLLPNIKVPDGPITPMRIDLLSTKATGHCVSKNTVEKK